MGIFKLAFSKKAREEFADQQAERILIFQEGKQCPFCHAETQPSDDQCPSCHKAITGPCRKCGARKPLAGMKCVSCNETFLDVVDKFSLLTFEDPKTK